MTTTATTYISRHTLIVCSWEQQARHFGDLLTPITSPYSPISWDDVWPAAKTWAITQGWDHNGTVDPSSRLEVYVGDTQGHVLGTIPFPYLAVEVEAPYADQMLCQVEVAAPPADDYDHGDRVAWQAVAAPKPVTRVSYRGVPRQIAEAVAATYAYDQAEEGAEPGTRVRAVIMTADDNRTVIAESGIHTVAALEDAI